MSNQEQAVRAYLTFLSDPNSLRDDRLIAKLQAEIDRASDPIDKLKAISAKHQAEAVDGSLYRKAFTQNAKAYAETNNITAAAFAELGVPNEDLRAAGFTIGRNKRSNTRAKRVTTDTIAASLPTGTFTSRDIENSTGASTGTVRRAISILLTAKKISEAGTDPNYPGRGRAPMRYTKA
jgi:hypothetical protein